jgi:hypothetical protein
VSSGLTFCARSRSLPLILRIPFLFSRTANDDQCQKGGNSRELNATASPLDSLKLRDRSPQDQ